MLSSPRRRVDNTPSALEKGSSIPDAPATSRSNTRPVLLAMLGLGACLLVVTLVQNPNPSPVNIRQLQATTSPCTANNAAGYWSQRIAGFIINNAQEYNQTLCCADPTATLRISSVTWSAANYDLSYVFKSYCDYFKTCTITPEWTWITGMTSSNIDIVKSNINVNYTCSTDTVVTNTCDNCSGSKCLCEIPENSNKTISCPNNKNIAVSAARWHNTQCRVKTTPSYTAAATDVTVWAQGICFGPKCVLAASRSSPALGNNCPTNPTGQFLSVVYSCSGSAAPKVTCPGAGPSGAFASASCPSWVATPGLPLLADAKPFTVLNKACAQGYYQQINSGDNFTEFTCIDGAWKNTKGNPSPASTCIVNNCLKTGPFVVPNNTQVVTGVYQPTDSSTVTVPFATQPYYLSQAYGTCKTGFKPSATSPSQKTWKCLGDSLSSPQSSTKLVWYEYDAGFTCIPA